MPTAIPTLTTHWNPVLMAAAPDAAIGSEEFVRDAGRAGRLLDPATYEALIDFGDRDWHSAGRSASGATVPSGVASRAAHDAPPVEAAGALLLRGVAVGSIGPTPDTPIGRTDKDAVSEFSLLTVARMLGQPIGYSAEHGGSVVQNISPTAADSHRQTSTSSLVTLGFHTETAFHPHRARYLLLLCLRGDPRAATTLCNIDDALAGLTEAEQRILREPRFRTRPDESFGGGPLSPFGDPAPVLTGPTEHPTMVFDEGLMAGTDSEANAALAALGRAVSEHHVELVLAAGDLLIVDNARCVHGRTPFTPRFDGTDRWLQRTFVRGDLDDSSADRQGRVFTLAFAGR